MLVATGTSRSSFDGRRHDVQQPAAAATTTTTTTTVLNYSVMAGPHVKFHGYVVCLVPMSCPEIKSGKHPPIVSLVSSLYVVPCYHIVSTLAAQLKEPVILMLLASALISVLLGQNYADAMSIAVALLT
jgi:hypothetical protein